MGTPSALQNEIVSRLASRTLTSLLMVHVMVSLFFALWEVRWPHIVPTNDSSVLEAARSARWAVLAFLERHEMQHFGLYLRRPAAVLLFEAANIIVIIQIIVIVMSVKYVIFSRNPETEV